MCTTERENKAAGLRKTEVHTMTREQKIQNILKATQELMEEKSKSGELTPEIAAAILECQNSAIAAVN